MTDLTTPVARRVINVISDRLSRDKDTIIGSQTIIGDLRADSLDIAELMMDIEDAFGIRLPSPDTIFYQPYTTTVADVIIYLEKTVNKG